MLLPAFMCPAVPPTAAAPQSARPQAGRQPPSVPLHQQLGLHLASAQSVRGAPLSTMWLSCLKWQGVGGSRQGAPPRGATRSTTQGAGHGGRLPSSATTPCAQYERAWHSPAAGGSCCCCWIVWMACRRQRRRRQAPRLSPLSQPLMRRSCRCQKGHRGAAQGPGMPLQGSCVPIAA